MSWRAGSGEHILQQQGSDAQPWFTIPVLGQKSAYAVYLASRVDLVE